MIHLPINRKWIQGNRGDEMHTMPANIPPYNQVSSMFGSFNLDLTNDWGDVKTTKLMKTTDSVSNTAMTDVPVGFRYFWDGSTARIYTVAGFFVHAATAADQSNFTKFTAATGYPTNCDSKYSDIEIFNNKLYVTTNGNAYYYDGTWHNFSIGSADSNPHLLTVYGTSSTAARMYCTRDRTNVISWDTSNTVASPGSTYTISVDGDMQIMWIRAASNRIWIGVGSLLNTSKRRGAIWEWDGASAYPITVHRIEASAPLACVIKDDVPYVMDSNGRMIYWNGGTFKEIARLPYYDRWPWDTTDSANNARYIHPNGMTLNGGRINILVNTTYYENSSPIPEFMPGGIWEFDENYGLYHKYSPSYVVPNTYTISDYGQFVLNSVGAISDMKVENTSSNANGRFLAGMSIFSDASTVLYGVFTDETAVIRAEKGGNTNATQKAGYLVTSKINSQNVTDIWQKVFITYKKFVNATDRIVLKYRISDLTPIYATITWTSTTTFTTTTDISGYAVGDEVEVIQGTGGGVCAHINSMSLSGSTWTVTIDETATGATGTAKARFQKWIKVNEVNDTVSQWKDASLQAGTSGASVWIQFKIWMLWTGDGEFDELFISNIPSIKA